MFFKIKQKILFNMFMDLVGLSSILIISLFVFLIAKTNRSLALILFVALGVRIFGIFINQHFMLLPDSMGCN